MTPEQVRLVQESFEAIAPSADTAATLFYNRLFTLDPTLRSLFKSDMSEQGKKLMATLALAVRGLSNPAQILPAVRHLGQRHVSYGVQPAHYQTVGEALLYALAQGLGERFTGEVRAAWEAAYTLLANLMQEAAAEVASSEAP